uniref:Uncharacterized protein n=1 Tax=Oryza punctata TaxID=4537 RepID=A0A0E0MF17_ORYPU
MWMLTAVKQYADIFAGDPWRDIDLMASTEVVTAPAVETPAVDVIKADDTPAATETAAEAASPVPAVDKPAVKQEDKAPDHAEPQVTTEPQPPPVAEDELMSEDPAAELTEEAKPDEAEAEAPAG